MRTVKTAFPALAALLAAAAAGAVELSPMRFFSGYEGGQVEEAFDQQNLRIDKEIINRASVWTLQEAKLADRARLYFGVGGAIFFVFPRNLGGNPYAHTFRSAFGLTEAHGEFDLWKPADSQDGLRLKTGVFGYKYNEDAKNLGEYLFRTWTYPVIINTGGLNYVNSTGAQLSGFGAFAKKGGLSNDLLLTIQSDHIPVGALSLTDIVSFRMGILTLGAGITLDNFYHPDKNALTPSGDEYLNNAYYTVKGGDKLKPGTKLSYRQYSEARDSLVSSQTDTSVHSPVGPNDTVIIGTDYYTFTGQKAMLRASLDLTGLLGELPHAERDFGLYFESVILGFKNYPTYYEKLADRIVYMAGANIPTFGLLQQLSLEVEYCAYPYRETSSDPNVQGSAVPNMVESFYPVNKPIHEDDWKWSVYAQRRFSENFSIYLQVANDHFRNAYIFGAPAFEGFLTQKNHWYWVFRLGYSI